MILRLNAQEFAAYHARLAQSLRPTIIRGIRSGGQRAVQFLIERTRNAPPANPGGIGSGGAVNTGGFINGWRSKDIADGVTILQVKGYGPIVEYGRRAGARMPPKDAIVQWAVRRLGLSREQAEDAQYVIRRAIKRRGLIGRQILSGDDAQTAIRNMVHQEILHELELELRRK